MKTQNAKRSALTVLVLFWRRRPRPAGLPLTRQPAAVDGDDRAMHVVRGA
jgi:hypothetical protein